MISWKPFTRNGIEYDLSHLHPKSLVFQRAAKGELPAIIYNVSVIYSFHCFTAGISPGQTVDTSMTYSDARDTRLFDLERYELSKRLPNLVEGLPNSKCFHTGYNNFFTIEMIKEDKESVRYEVYFTASKSGKKGVVNLYVQSAYPQNKNKNDRRPKKSVGFFVILHNTLNERPLHPAQ